MAERAAAATVPVWDRAVRAIHWALAAACLGAWVTTAAGLRWHEPLGYAALALVAVRFVWGLAGPRYARFSQFIRGPRATLRYAAQVRRDNAPRYLGHNPLGGWMAAALWTWVALLGLTGWLYTTDAFWGEPWLDRFHELLGWSLLGLVALHVAGVVHASRTQGENLLVAMLSGRKRAPRDGDVT
jgi:cytochrome b